MERWPDSPDAEKELDRCVTDLDMREVLPCSNLAGRRPAEPQLLRVFARAVEMDIAVLLHPARRLITEQVKGYNLTSKMGNMFENTIARARVARRVPERPGHVDLLVDFPDGVDVPAGYPVTTGVPFADGWLKNMKGLMVETEDGRAIPAQFEIRGTYPRSKNVRWLGVDFQLDPSARSYRLVIDGGAGPTPSSRVKIDKRAESFIVTTADLKVEQPLAGPMLAKVWIQDNWVVDQASKGGNWFTTLGGQRHTEKVEEVTAEREGPLHATLRVKGRYVDPRGKPSCKFSVRFCRASGFGRGSAGRNPRPPAAGFPRS